MRGGDKVVVAADAASGDCKGIGGSRGSPQHRFFFINEVLCRAETADSSFRPSDVFVGLDPPSRGASLLGTVSPGGPDAPAGVSGGGGGGGGLSRDCPIFNTFGVLSGGVLLDPNTKCFVDFTDDMIVAPSICHKENGNNTHHESLAYSQIQGEGVLSLCSSIEPFNTMGTDRTPLSWPRSLPTLSSTSDACRLARRNVRHIMGRCVPGVPLNRETFALLEGFRCHIKSTRPQNRFMATYIPFRFQHGGREYQEMGSMRSSDDGNSGTNTHVCSAASSWSEFHTLTGCLRKVHQIVSRESRGLEARVQRLVQPLRRGLSIENAGSRASKESVLKQSWWTFLRYFDFLRVHPSSTPSAEGRIVWELLDDSDVKYTTAVRRFVEARRNGKRRSANMADVIDAWDWLLKHNRDQLMQRIAKIKNCAKKLGTKRKTNSCNVKCILVDDWILFLTTILTLLDLCREVKYATVSATAGKLNALLDVRRREEEPVPRNTLEQFLRENVMPVLRGTALDRRHDSAEVRRSLSQLLRDAAFAAVVLRASPTGAYINALVDCIKHDHQRMQFIHKMTSNQASRVIEHLCRAGVRDSGVYAPLVSRLDFNILKEVARAMFALAEEGMYLEVLSFIVPLYSGEKWALTFDGGEGKNGQGNKNCNVFDAIRLLRVLSKAVRGVVEQNRLDQFVDHAHPLPTESIQRLRTNVTDFIIQNSNILRGAHWINFTRAMVHFPEEFKTMKYLEQCPEVVRAIDAVQFTPCNSTWRLSRSLSTDDLASLGMDRIFTLVERRQVVESCDAKPTRGFFDVQTIDLSKLFSIIEDVPIPRAVQQRRLELVVQAIVDEIESLSFTDLVRFLQSLRRIEGTGSFATALEAATAALNRRLTAEVGEVRRRRRRDAGYIPYKRFVQLATLLSAFRVKSCRGFATYLLQIAPELPYVSVEDATSFMNALSTIGAFDGVGLCARVGEQILDKMSVDSGLDGPALLLVFPVSCAKLLRAAVLLGAVPSSNAITRIFGSTGEKLKVSPELRAAGASVLFDISRSLYHLCRMKPSDTVCEMMLWSRGVVGALMPLLTQLTSELHQECVSAHGGPMRATYVPIAWRSAIEAVFPYVDVNLDVVSLETMQQRIGDVYWSCREILRMAVDIVETQRRTLEKNPSVEPIAFSSNSMIHLVFLLIMLEHMLYHGTWQAEISSDTTVRKGVLERMQAMKTDYNELLSSPLSTESEGKGLSLLSEVEGLLPSGGKQDAQRSPFDRGAILEITTNLPFAVSLVVKQGPINKLLCDRALESMLETDV